MSEVLYVQPYDRPIIFADEVKKRSMMFLSRAQFEVGYCVAQEYSINFLDLNVAVKKGQQPDETVIEAMRQQKPKIVFISFPTYAQGYQVELILSAVRRVDKNVKIVLGGAALNLVHSAPFDWWKEHKITFCYNGFGQEISAICDLLIKNRLDCIPGVYWQIEYENNNRRGVKKLLDGYGASNFYTSCKQFNWFDHVHFAVRQCGLEPIGILEMARGCRFGCRFCSLNNRRLGCFSRSPKTVADEVWYMAQSFNINHFHIIDPTFGLHAEKTAQLLDELAIVKSVFPNIRFEVMSRPEFITEVFAASLKKIGVIRCGLGLETLETDLLGHENKKTTANVQVAAIQNLAANGIEAKLFHILFPSRLSERTLNFFCELAKQKIPFIVQSSFLRKLPTAKSMRNFLAQDRTIYNPEADTKEQIMEYMLANLAFGSIDAGDGDPDLQRKIYRALNRNKNLMELLVASRDSKQRVKIQLGDYQFREKPGRAMNQCLERRKSP